MQLNLNYSTADIQDQSSKKIADETYLWNHTKYLLNEIPDQYVELQPGLKWGSVYQLYTPAFWKLHYLLNGNAQSLNEHRISGSIIEEVVVCILGGYGIPSEMGMLAFARLKEDGLIASSVSLTAVQEALTRPFVLSEGKTVRYRFHNQKAKFVHAFLNKADLNEIPISQDLELRKWLLGVNGIGPKTASWITRNWLQSERVAILDVHLLRAGVITGFFKHNFNLDKQYYELEQQYLRFCSCLEVKPSNMDAIIWSYMKKNNKLAINILSSII
jgi:N-glycosylase/DNA lyase